MRTIQLAAIVFLIVGTVAAGFTIRQIIDTTVAEPRLQGPAPYLIGDAPPPATSTPAPQAATGSQPATATTTPGAGNLAPPADSRLSTRPPAAQTNAAAGSALGSSSNAAKPPESQLATPVSLNIPEVGIQAAIVPVGLNDRGEMASPDDFFQAGWWQHGAVPGEPGRAVLAGHVDTPDGKAIFYGIDALQPGDEIFVTLAGHKGDGKELRFIVTGAALYHVDHAPVDQIFGTSGERELILITCGGVFDHSTGAYLYRQVVFAALVM